MTRRLLIAGVVLALVAGAGGVLYAFGTPQAPVSPARVTAAADPAAAPAAPPVATGREEAFGDDPPKADGEAPAPDPNSPLAIEIPGCRCHSDDPKLVAQHAEYRMNQCAGCHAGQVPTGQ
jgi:hypothetical protein